jgi:hypothetical protein
MVTVFVVVLGVAVLVFAGWLTDRLLGWRAREWARNLQSPVDDR